ncbi:hypothetical protein BDV28DRAFT_133407 [Aspergillus coremiiformis]|uniref:Uncharacterized protein n=1 Tax=Aspergillus coremiiformis TaxID=138285 RepID=A0A5N6Z6K0_9EURO|nr:hypothetical protein BDV28DRAFT_133407 [Aspergillus coremiiformis]
MNSEIISQSQYHTGRVSTPFFLLNNYPFLRYIVGCSFFTSVPFPPLELNRSFYSTTHA